MNAPAWIWLAAALLVVLFAAQTLASLQEQTKAWMPARLKAAKLVRVEEDLVTDRPYRVVGRPDQVYRDADGLHFPVELKNRPRVVIFDTDVAEISLRGWLLRRNGMPTARTGYVVINGASQGARQAIEVVLRDDMFCEDLVQRYIDLIDGRRRPRRSMGRKCEACGHAARCQNTTSRNTQ